MGGGLHESYRKIYKVIKRARSDHVSSLGGECFDDYTNYLGKRKEKGDAFQCFLSRDFGYELVYHVEITPSQFFKREMVLLKVILGGKVMPLILTLSMYRTALLTFHVSHMWV